MSHDQSGHIQLKERIGSTRRVIQITGKIRELVNLGSVCIRMLVDR